MTPSSSFGPSLECPVVESAQISWINPLSAALIFLDLALVIGPTGTCNGSFNSACVFSSSPILLAKRTRWHDWGKCVSERSFVHPKKHVFGWNFLMKPAPFLFFGPNWLYGAFGDKIVPVKNFAQFWLKCPIEFIFPNDTFLVEIFWLNRPHNSFLGLIGYKVRSGTKLFRTKTLLNFISKAISDRKSVV